jgi:hypothetical protein
MKKPAKPHPDFPLFPHANGQWAKKVKGRPRYFGPWSDPEAALAKWLEQKDDLIAGRNPSPAGSLTIGYLVNHFLADCEQRVESSELQPRTYADYDTVCQRVLKVLGFNSALPSLRPEDFGRLRASFAKTHGSVALCVGSTQRAEAVQSLLPSARQRTSSRTDDSPRQAFIHQSCVACRPLDRGSEGSRWPFFVGNHIYLCSPRER